MTHQELVNRALRWLSRRCFAVAAERGDRLSRVDAIGWAGIGSCLVEAKATRDDFFRDSRKPCRAGTGVGNFRYFACPDGRRGGLIRPEEVGCWGLLWVDHLRVTVKKRSDLFPRDAELELELLLTALREGPPKWETELDAECLPDVNL